MAKEAAVRELRIMELRVSAKETYADVVSPDLPGPSSVGATPSTAVAGYLQQNGKALGLNDAGSHVIRIIVEPVR